MNTSQLARQPAAKTFKSLYKNLSDFTENNGHLSEDSELLATCLPAWALEAIFEHFTGLNAPVVRVTSKHDFMRQFTLTHRGAALDCYFDNIIAINSETGQYLIHNLN